MVQCAVKVYFNTVFKVYFNTVFNYGRGKVFYLQCQLPEALKVYSDAAALARDQREVEHIILYEKGKGLGIITCCMYSGVPCTVMSEISRSKYFNSTSPLKRHLNNYTIIMSYSAFHHPVQQEYSIYLSLTTSPRVSLHLLH